MLHIFLIVSLLIKIKHKVFHFLCNIPQIKKLDLPKSFSQNYHLFRHGSLRKYVIMTNSYVKALLKMLHLKTSEIKNLYNPIGVWLFSGHLEQRSIRKLYFKSAHLNNVGKVPTFMSWPLVFLSGAWPCTLAKLPATHQIGNQMVATLDS